VKIYAWLVLVLPGFCNAYVTGGGATELSISVEKEKHNLGAAGSYELNSVSPRLETQFSSQFQLGTNLGRSTQAVAEHAYQYEQSYIETSGGLDYIFPSRSINWQSGYNSRTDFVQNDEFDSTTNSNFDEIENSLAISTGPRLTFNRLDGTLIEASIDWSYMNSEDEFTTENGASISFLRSITPVTQLGLNSSRLCAEYDVASENNVCRTQYNIIFSIRKKYFDVNVEAGVSSEGGASTDIYSGALNYTMNSYSDISLLQTKSISTILNNGDSVFEVQDYILSTLISTKSIGYSYRVGGRNLSIGFMEQSLIAGSNNITSSTGSVDFNHRVYSKLCSYCVLSLNYDYSNYNDERIKKISTIALTKSNSRNLSTSINFSQTRIKSELDIWSIGILFTYSGRQTKLGDR